MVALIDDVFMGQALENSRKVIGGATGLLENGVDDAPVVGCITADVVAVLVEIAQGAERPAHTRHAKHLWGVLIEAAFDLELQGATVLDGGRGPVVQGSVFVLVPDVFAAEEHVACLAGELPPSLLPVALEDPFAEMLLDSSGIAAQSG